MRGKPRRALLLTGALGGLLVAGWASAQGVSGVINEEQSRIKRGQSAQDEVDKIAEATRKRFDEYQQVLKEIENQKAYNGVLQTNIDGQEAQITDLKSSIDRVTIVEREIPPLMTQMIDGLERFIRLDVPFLLDKRLQRVTMLRDLQQRADVTAAEQFRQVMAAWQDEDSYGRFPDTYSGDLDIDGSPHSVDYLMVGRIGFYYVTPDNSLAGAWDQRARKWVPVGRSDALAIREGIQDVIDSKRTGSPPANLLMLPVAPPEEN